MGASLRDSEVTFADRVLRVRLSLTDALPPLEHISTAHCLGFADDGRFLLARHVSRAWTIPGGHLEPGESAIDAVRREALEEAAAVVTDERLVAVERIDHVSGPRDPRYPDPAYQVFFACRVVSVDVLVPNAECTESRLFAVDDARRLPGWMDHNQVLFDAVHDGRSASRMRDA